MGIIEPTRPDIEVGGMQWEVTPPGELRDGHALRMTCVEDFSQGPGYPMADRTTITKLDDGSVHVAFDSERNESFYSASHEFPAGTLRAIIDHVEPTAGEAGASQPARAPRRGWLGGWLSRRATSSAG